MNKPWEWGKPSEAFAAKLWNSARRQRSHKWTPILSLASTALELSPCFNRIYNNIVTFQELDSLWLYVFILHKQHCHTLQFSAAS